MHLCKQVLKLSCWLTLYLDSDAATINPSINVSGLGHTTLSSWFLPKMGHTCLFHLGGSIWKSKSIKWNAFINHKALLIMLRVYIYINWCKCDYDCSVLEPFLLAAQKDKLDSGAYWVMGGGQGTSETWSHSFCSYENGCHSHEAGCYSAIKRKGVRIQAAQMNLKDMMLS